MLLHKRWEPDGRDSLSPTRRMLLSIFVSGVVGFLLEYVGIEVLGAFSNADPLTLYAATAIWAFGLGPLLVTLRRASIVVPMAIVGVSFFVLVLFNHYYFIIWEFSGGSYIDTGKLWAPRIWEFTKGAIFGFDHPLLIAVAAGMVETVVVPVSVVIQKLLTAGRRRGTDVHIDDVKAFFQGSIMSWARVKPERDFGFFLMRFIFFAYGLYFIYMVIGLVVGGKDLPIVSMMFINPAETVNTVMKLTLMISLSAIGAYNSEIRREAAIFLVIGHMISVVGSLMMYFSFPLNPLFPMDQQFLLSTVVGDGILVIGLVYVMMAPKRQESTLEQIDDVELRTPPSTLMRTYFLVFGTMFSLFTGAIIYFRFSGDPEVGLGAVFGGPDPLVSNSLTKYGTLAAIAWVLFRKPSLRKYFIPTMVTAFTFSLVATIAYGFQGSTMLISRLGTTVTLPWFMMNHVVVDGGGILLLLGVRWLQYHVDFQIASLRPSSAECVIALNQAFREERLRPEKAWRDVLKGIDEYIVSMRGRRRGLVSFPFWLLEHVFPFVCSFRPPFSTMSRTEGRWFLRRHVLRPIYERQTALVPAMADLMYQMGDIAHGLVTFSYYGTDHAHDQIGYIRADARARLQTEVATEAPPTKTEILQYPRDHRDPIGWRPISESSRTSKILAPRLGSPLHPDSIPREVDYCIIGSGAAGGVLAYRLGKEKGGADSICVLERGGSYGPRRDFSENEMKMISMLYTEGGLQVTRSFDFTILQAECVGGTTVVNNAVCFRMPEETASEWSNFGIDTAALSSHYDSIAAEINISPVIDESVNSSAQKLFVEGVRKYNASLRSADKLSPVQKNLGNFTNCLGCGQCNIGCRYMRKLSALETYVPWAQAHGVSVIRSVGAVQCETEQRGEKKVVNAVIVRDANGSFQRIRIRKALIVSAGAIASSRFLMRSGVGGEGVGRFLSCNFAIPPLVTFENPVNAFDGVQMPLHALSDYGEAIYETSFNMPGSYAISFPLYFDPHAGMMDSYAKSVNFTALVWSDPAGSVSLKRDVLFGRAIQWDQTPNDLLRIKRALATIIRVAREAGAKRVILPTLPPVEVPMDAFVEERIKDMERVINHKKYINFITAHPQGGNMMAADTFNERVADLDFRVRGCENLFVCDASVFPRGVRVNPQWTIMALASKASGHIMSLT